MYNDLQGKVAVVTGSSRGIGAAVVSRLVAEGMNVVINYHSDKKEAQCLADDLNKLNLGKAIIFGGDISNEDVAHNFIYCAINYFGKLDLLINNAGIETQTPSHAVDLADWRKIIDVNLTSYFLTARSALRYFVENKIQGNIINMSSVHEIIPWPTFASYAASKGGVRMLTQSLALEYASKGIRINSIGPGAINTPINQEKMQDDTLREELEEMIPMKYAAEPEVVANVAAWLASEQSTYITGQTIFIDGGMTLYSSFQSGKG
ncbi:glucose 1-dehydrogenase [Proteus faecis]|uniref:glucose 1-dehydrogenase n=1 Tax=Proteus faecis TaxID=2050967 RepID=UPI003513E71A